MNQIQKDQLIGITIKKIGINGEGIGYYKRLAVFIDNALVGEMVEAKITKVEEKYAYGEIVKIKNKSPHRITPKCIHYEKCGGCQIQHMDYNESLHQKRNIVIDAFLRYYDGDVSNLEFKDTLGMKNPWNYRNKTSLPVRHDGDKVVVGMYAKNTNMLVFIDKCMIEEELVSTVTEKVLEVLTKANIDIYNPKFHQGSLRYLVVRGFEETKEVQVTLVLMKEDKKIINTASKIMEIEHVKSVNYSINSDQKSIEIFGEKIVCIAGTKEIAGKIDKLEFAISPNSFLQLNLKQTKILYEEIKKACNLTGRENIVDCFSGIGSIGLYLASNAKEVRGIDINKEAIENARRFANLNNIDNASFYSGNIVKELTRFESEGFKTNILVVDPPRKGMELALLNYIQKSNINRIIYVSCNPSTLAKNINHLQKHYKVEYIQPIDMFPQTAAVEAVVLLTRK